MNREELYAIVEDKVNEAFLAYQKANGIKDGGIYPLEALQLDDLQNKLTDLIVSATQRKIPQTIRNTTSIVIPVITNSNTANKPANDPTDISSRLDKITAHSQKLQDEATRKKETAEKERLLALERISELTPRIQRVITLANACNDANIQIPTGVQPVVYGYSHEFFAEWFYHHTGFMGHGTMPITHLGIYAGGYCGCWDFYTDGVNTFERHEDDYKLTQNASLFSMRQFLGEFERFEAAFLKWIDLLDA